jgi:hypothetical protein
VALLNTPLASVSWQLLPYAGHWLPDADLGAVTEWMRDNRLVRATAQRPVVVEHGQVTYGRDDSPATVRAAQRVIVTATVPLRTAPPAVWCPDIDETGLAALTEVFAAHEWSAGFDGVCVDCSAIQIGPDGRVYCHVDDAVAWPCPPVRDVMAAVGVPVPGERPPRILGDCLDPDDNARLFGADTPAAFSWTCTEPACPMDEALAGPGDCAGCAWPLTPIDQNGYEVTTQ